MGLRVVICSVCCMFVGVFGTSKYLIAGPTTAIAILLQTSIVNVIYNYYPDVTGLEKDALSLSILCHIVLIMGIIQVIFSLCNMGKILQFISRSVVLVYFAGVILAIIINQLYPFLGIEKHMISGSSLYKLWNLFLHLKDASIITFLLGSFSCVTISFSS